MIRDKKISSYVSSYIHFQKLVETPDSTKHAKEYLLDSDLGRAMGFDRLAIHHVILKPGQRSSVPHAESLEEEFIFVLKGNPDLWRNGWISTLSSGHAVGFPSGTGVAHCFINNSLDEVHLLVAGEKSKTENRYYYPLHPHLKSAHPQWWSEAPTQVFGPHAGLPGPVGAHEIGKLPEEVIFCPLLPKGKPFHYPGDNETFGIGTRLSYLLKLKRLGIWYECLNPGTRSSFPHAHTQEEEFVYILEGTPHVWLQGESIPVSPGDFAAFPSNTGLAHTIINDSDREVYYLCVGEASEFPEEKISYPLNPLRQNEMDIKGFSWSPQTTGKEHWVSAEPINPFSDHLVFSLAQATDLEKVLEIYKAAPEYFWRVDGILPTEATVLNDLTDGPKKRGSKYYKQFLIITWMKNPVGVLDLHFHHPEDKCCYLGLLLLRTDKTGAGLGKKVYALAEDYIRRAGECDRIKLGVSQANDVSAFWEKMGFKPNGNSYEWQGKNKKSAVKEYEKEIGGLKR